MEAGSEVVQSCPTLCDAIDCSLPGSSIHGIFQARILEWVAIFFPQEIFPTQGISHNSSSTTTITYITHTYIYTHTPHIHTRAQECAQEKKDGKSMHNVTQCPQLVNLAEEYDAVHCIILATF